MANAKKILTLVCKADLRIDTCNVAIRHKGDIMEICGRCEHSEIVYTPRGAQMKNSLESRRLSWEKEFGVDYEQI